MKKANILLLMTDQQRWDALGHTGGWVRTPNLDCLAAEGISFSHCNTNAPECIPTRVALATGLYPHNTGVWDNCRYTLPKTQPTWVQAIREAGYRTSLFGKLHLHHHADLRDGTALLRAYGFDDGDEIAGPRGSMHVISNMTEQWRQNDVWQAYRDDYQHRFREKPHMVRPSALPLADYADVYVGQQATRYLREYAHAKPWFCWVSFGGPHEPWDAPEPYASMYPPAQMPLPVPRPARTQDSPRGVLDDLLEGPPQLTRQEVAALRANYAGNITLIDDQIGEILEVIEARGELEHTIIAFCSDHGEMNGDYGLLYKSNFLEGSVRVPLLFCTPETRTGPHAGTVSEALIEWFDLGPTLVELAGGVLRHRQFARSLCPLLYAPQTTHRAYAIAEYKGEIMIRDARWKMVLNREGRPYLLFDLIEDPHEQRNLAGAKGHAKVVQHWSLKILEHLVQTPVLFNM